MIEFFRKGCGLRLHFELIRHLIWICICSREKSTLEEVLQDQHVETILHVSGLSTNEPDTASNHGYPGTTSSFILFSIAYLFWHKSCIYIFFKIYLENLEGLKVLFNMIFQSSAIRTMFVSHGLLEALTNNVKNYTTSTSPTEVKYFTMRTLFIITALCQEAGYV